MAGFAARPNSRIGRFELLRVLGRGAQSTVWLARDSRLEREVALKLIEGDDTATAAALGEGLAEARAVAALNHPHIVAVFEADMHQPPGAAAQSYLVFEVVPGESLAERLKSKGPIAPRATVELLLGAVDAIAQAHAAGVVHRDIKPSNLLLDVAGRARVTDFGIAARTHPGAAPVAAAGTPRYVAPETLAGDAPTPAVDVFALGLLVAECLLGRPLVDEKGAEAAMARIARGDREPLALPPSTPQPVDDALRAIVNRCLAHDAAARFRDAGELHAALLAWLTPSAVTASDAPDAAPKAGVLEFLLRRMRHKSDFPALSDAVSRIQRVANAENESLGSLAAEILKDVALTHKLLRLVNTASYSHAGGGTISTVSRAVALIGFAGIRNLALSLVLLEHMNDKLHAEQIKQEFVRSLLAGTLASELSASSRDAEEGFIAALMCNLGRLLTEFYFPEEAEQVRRLVRPGAAPARETPRLPVPEAQASASVLGLSYEELGVGVARSWGLPESLQRAMRPPAGASPSQPPAQAAERLRWLAAASNEVADALLHAEPHEAAQRVNAVAERHARALGLAPRDVAEAVQRARARLTQLADGLQLRLKPGSAAERLLDRPLDAKAAAEAAFADTISGHALGDPRAAAAAASSSADAAGVLAAGIQDITATLVGDSFKLNEVLRMILETMYRALGLRRIVFCLRDARSGELVGRLALGAGSEGLAPRFRIALKPAPGQPIDLFAAVSLKGADTLIADATLPAIAPRLPAWFKGDLAAPTFLLLPLVLKNAPIGLIYADQSAAGAIRIEEKELALLRTLRNQAVMAFRQASGG
ncbi:protein kinase domain-containing protein [Caldimonas sp. KR1-144]|uniref:protein kinase domain-containing protein n=1 Tax=Caldimonas sp. KR1-144 TaxID=3400911 RepID=UPI003C0FB7CD